MVDTTTQYDNGFEIVEGTVVTSYFIGELSFILILGLTRGYI